MPSRAHRRGRRTEDNLRDIGAVKFAGLSEGAMVDKAVIMMDPVRRKIEGEMAYQKALMAQATAQFGPERATIRQPAAQRKNLGWVAPQWDRIAQETKGRSSDIAKYDNVSDVLAWLRAVEAYVKNQEVALRRRFPDQFSGGQRQRIAIAWALAMQPDLLVLDEPVASLDVSIQAQVLNLFLDLRQQLGLTAVFISHDLGVVRHVSDRVAIMYLGRIVELADTVPLFDRPAHPYTRAQLDSVPKLGAGRGAFSAVSGEIPSPLNPPPGCAFHPRCPFAGPRCSVERPILKAGDNTPGTVACHLYDGGTGA